ncbi:MAG: hypothetical protein M3Q89_13655 [Verrucomicrobiota bacterium]|nr:hypothetical protein [Verrucomicrobiota bacterium]
MNLKTALIIMAVGIALQFAPPASAQGGRQEFRRERREARLANLSGDERAKLRAANRQAMADPAVQAARDRQRQAARDFRQLKRAALLRADPTIQPILEKLPSGPAKDS